MTIITRGFKAHDLIEVKKNIKIKEDYKITALAYADLDMFVGDFIDLNLTRDPDFNGIIEGRHFVLFSSPNVQDYLSLLMQNFKDSIQAKAGEIIFAVLTKTSIKYSFNYYFRELEAEHKMMSARSTDSE